MKVGMSLTSNHPDARDPRQGARWMIERTAAAHRAGLYSLFIGDQHVSATPYYQNMPMLGRLLAEWGEAPAGCLFLLPLWPPVLVAEQIGTLASITEGPFSIAASVKLRRDDFMLSPFCASATDTPRGSCFSSRLAPGHLMMG